MKNEQIGKIKKDIRSYKVVIEDAEDALRPAEWESDEEPEDTCQDKRLPKVPDEKNIIYLDGNGDTPSEVLIELSINHTTVVSRKVIITNDELPF